MEKVSIIAPHGLPVFPLDLDGDSFYECSRLMAGFGKSNMPINFIHWVRFNASFKSASLKRL